MFLWDKQQTTITTKQETLARRVLGCLVSVDGYESVSLRAEAATRPRWTVSGWVLTEEESRGKGGRIQYESEVLQLGLCESTEDR